MIAIRVVSRAGVPLTAPLVARFADTIGDIGRSADCTLVLPDPDRKISRKQALITPREDGHFLCPIGANLIVELDGEPLAPDAEYALTIGAEIRIGPYLLKVERVRESMNPRMEPPVVPAPAPAAAARRPAAPPETLPPVPVRAPRLEPPPGPAPVPPTMFAERDRELDDPMEIFDRPRDTPRASVFRDLLGSPTPTPPGPRPTPPRQAPLPAPVPPPPPASQARPAEPAPMARVPSPVRPASSPPMAASPAPSLAPPVSPPPLRPSLRPSPPTSPSPLPPPPVAMPRPATRDVPARPPAASHPVSSPVSVPAPPPPAATREVDIHVGEPTGSGGRRMRRDKATPRPDIRDARQEPAEVGPAVDDLVAALYDGLNMPLPGVMARSPQQMRLIGELLREAIAGTLDLLAARTIAKRELGASSTLLQARENNPLKFSPDADAALAHLLGPPERGFIGPQAAVHDAFGDLRAHQVAVLAGMRAALDAVLARFDPAALEVRLAPPGMLENLVPATRRAKLWENYSNQYAQILREVEGDFDTLFGRAFLQAYKAQLEEFARGVRSFDPPDDP